MPLATYNSWLQNAKANFNQGTRHIQVEVERGVNWDKKKTTQALEKNEVAENTSIFPLF